MEKSKLRHEGKGRDELVVGRENVNDTMKKESSKRKGAIIAGSCVSECKDGK